MTFVEATYCWRSCFKSRKMTFRDDKRVPGKEILQNWIKGKDPENKKYEVKEGHEKA